MFRIFLIAIVCSFQLSLEAQFNLCIDSGRINPIYQCNDAFYNPVCGCDGVTYRNQCAAYNVHGVTDWRGGVCSGIDVDFFPNPIGPNSEFTVNLSFPEFIMANADVKIVDVYGKVWNHRIINNFNRVSLQFDTRTLMTGIYMLVVTNSIGSGRVDKFAKY